MSATIIEALKAIDGIQSRLDTLLNRLEHAETEKARLTAELRKARTEIETLRSQRDTARATTYRQ